MHTLNTESWTKRCIFKCKLFLRSNAWNQNLSLLNHILKVAIFKYVKRCEFFFGNEHFYKLIHMVSIARDKKKIVWQMYGRRMHGCNMYGKRMPRMPCRGESLCRMYSEGICLLLLYVICMPMTYAYCSVCHMYADDIRLLLCMPHVFRWHTRVDLVKLYVTFCRLD